MKMGKLPKELLESLLQSVAQGPDVILGPGYGEDAAAVLLSKEVMVAASDPITFATQQIGWYAVTVNANDIAASGAVPKFFLATVLLPKGTKSQEAAVIFRQISDTCRDLNISLVGGHTEVTDAVNRPVVSGVMFGEIDKEHLITTSGARVGDSVLLVGSIAVEGTALLALEAAEELRRKGVGEDIIEKSAAMLKCPGICILDYARKALECSGINSMHDPTEGGLASALAEIAGASGCGIVVYADEIPVLNECSVICSALGLDALGLIASGSLLISCHNSSANTIINHLKKSGIDCAKIGEIVATGGVRFADGTQFPSFERDELARYFEGTN